MQISFQTPSLDGPGAVAMGVAEGNVLSGLSERADKLVGGAIRRALSVSRFCGKPGQLLELIAPTGLKASRLVLAGLGSPAKFDAQAAERLAAGVVGKLFNSGEKAITFLVEAPKEAKVGGAALAAHLAFGARLRSYTFNAYRTKERDEHEPTLERVAIGTANVSAAQRAFGKSPFAR